MTISSRLLLLTPLALVGCANAPVPSDPTMAEAGTSTEIQSAPEAMTGSAPDRPMVSETDSTAAPMSPRLEDAPTRPRDAAVPSSAEARDQATQDWTGGPGTSSAS